MIDIELAWKRYDEQRKAARGRNDVFGNPIEFRLTFAEWIMIWIESGKYHLRGVRRGEYCMSRINDIGHYEVGNVRIILNSENISAAQKGRPSPKKGIPRSKEICAKIAAGNKGQTRTPETKAKMSAAMKGIPKTKIQCPHCGKWGGSSNMKRYHFDNCKKAPAF
jgi:hypothetical protein